MVLVTFGEAKIGGLNNAIAGVGEQALTGGKANAAMAKKEHRSQTVVYGHGRTLHGLGVS